MTIAAKPAELLAVGQGLHHLAGSIKSLTGTCPVGGGGTGDREADAALEEFQARWTRQLDRLAVQVAAYGAAGQIVASAFEQAGR